MPNCYLYIIRCKNNALYTGITNDPIRRWKEHFKGRGAKYIKMNGFGIPVYLQAFKTRSEAMRAERALKKKSKAYKEFTLTSTLNILQSDPSYAEKMWFYKGHRGLPFWTKSKT